MESSKLKKNRTLLIAFVVVMIAGLVAAYVPLIFSPPPLAPESAAQPENVNPDQLLIPVEPTSTEPTVLPTSSAPQSGVPETKGFSGLSEEGQSLQDLDSLLGE
ncbi:MAG: hypothetical protein V1696_00440 [Candidatus Jorgensenbacteria bacterium]